MKVTIEIRDFDKFVEILQYPELDLETQMAESIFKDLPEHIRFIAYQHGCGDNLFWEEAFEYLMDKKYPRED